MSSAFISKLTGEMVPMLVAVEVTRVKLANGTIVPCQWEDEIASSGVPLVRHVHAGKLPRGRISAKLFPGVHPGHYIRGRGKLSDGTIVEGIRPSPLKERDLVSVKKQYRAEAANAHRLAYECDCSLL